MALITEKMIQAAYDAAKNIYEGAISHKAGLDILESNYGMNRNSASDYVHNYICLVEGKRFTRTTNAYGTRYYLEKMYADGGRTRLLNALSALKQHLDYYEVIVNTNVVTRRNIYQEFARLAMVDEQGISYPDEVDEPKELLEGKIKSINVNVYERNPVARTQCIEHYGCSCYVCGFNFSKEYGVLGENFIHVHHEIEISSIGSEYSIDPIKDLKPVCPNCHAMIHRKKPAYSIAEIKKQLASDSSRSYTSHSTD